jgi:uncharacterized RmlC-like cupin family protein
MFEETVPAGTKSLFHLHRDSDEVAWVLAGEIIFKIGDEVYTPAAAGGYVEEFLKRPAGPRSDDEGNKLRERYRWGVVGPNPL